MLRAIFLMAALFVGQISFAAPSDNKKVIGVVEILDNTKADFTLFIKLTGDDREFRLNDTNNQSAQTEKTIKALEKSYNAHLEGEVVKVEIEYTPKLVIMGASVKK